jgi:hypothetical protein
MKGENMFGEFKFLLPLEDKETRSWGSPKGKHAVAWRRHWHNLLVITKSLRRSKVRYEVEYHFGAEVPFATILAGGSCRQGILLAA